MNYVDGFVIPLAKDKVEDYRKMAEMAGKIWMEHGALAYRECVGEDLDIKDMLSFTKISDAKADETVVFAFIEYRSREHRDEVNAKVMADERMKNCMPETMPFDCKRMAYGGFKAIVEF